MNDAEDTTRYGGQVTAFIGGHAASLVFSGARGRRWSCSVAPNSVDNREALRRLLVGTLCWLDGLDQLVLPAMNGDVTARLGRKGHEDG